MAFQESKHFASPPSDQINSLQYISRYLKMDLKKVFMDKEHVSPELLAKVEKARLKVELCEDCGCLNKTFSDVYRQLEKLEMELGSTLKLILGKFVSADTTDKLRGLNNAANSNVDGLLEVLDVLRAEAIQKSSRKLAVTPLVKVQNLSKKKIRAKQYMLKKKLSRNQESSQLATSTDYASEGGMGMSGAKMESLNDESSVNEDCCFDDVDFKLDGYGGAIEEDAEPRQQITESNVDAKDSFGTGNMIVDKNVVSQKARNIRVGAGKWSINPETGKRKCNDCFQEFNGGAAFSHHYQAVHLKLRYKCILCSKLFTRKTSLELHQRTSQSCSTIESALKYNCHLCEKVFVHNHVLQNHLDSIHYKLRKYACDLCEKKFNTNGDLITHRRKVHRGIKQRL